MEIKEIASQFQFQGTISKIKPFGDGLINDTFLVETEGNTPNYILQRKNKNIFTDVPAMMDNINRVTMHLKKKIIAAGGDPNRESLTVTPTKDGKLCYEDKDGEYWAACICISDNITYHSADTPELAAQGGMGIGQFQTMLADFTESLTNILPGFHDMRFRFEQWDNILAKDPVGRKSQVAKEVKWVEDRRKRIMEVWEKVESGEIPTRVTHNDTKINNILFTTDGKILCVIDLDTVLSSTILNDFGDAIRTYTNAAKEDEKDLDKVYMRLNIFEGFTKGYLSEAKSFLTESEIKYLAFSAMYITIEQVLRFLMDYIDGDNYYRTEYDDHNLVRTRAQIKLCESMEKHYEEMQALVEKLVK